MKLTYNCILALKANLAISDSLRGLLNHVSALRLQFDLTDYSALIGTGDKTYNYWIHGTVPVTSQTHPVQLVWPENLLPSIDLRRLPSLRSLDMEVDRRSDDEAFKRVHGDIKRWFIRTWASTQVEIKLRVLSADTEVHITDIVRAPASSSDVLVGEEVVLPQALL